MKLKPKCSNTKVILHLYKLKRSKILTVYQMKTLFMTADNARVAGPKRGEKSLTGFKAIFFVCKIDKL